MGNYTKWAIEKISEEAFYLREIEYELTEKAVREENLTEERVHRYAEELLDKMISRIMKVSERYG